MEAKITPRDGIDPAVLAEATEWYPLRAPDLWVTREEAAKKLGVGDRTIDRYIRSARLTGYTGPVEGGGYGVRVLRSEVDGWANLVKVVGLRVK